MKSLFCEQFFHKRFSRGPNILEVDDVVWTSKVLPENLNVATPAKRCQEGYKSFFR